MVTTGASANRKESAGLDMAKKLHTCRGPRRFEVVVASGVEIPGSEIGPSILEHDALAKTRGGVVSDRC
jgi:hypothetical protein